jgi:hypothetical protein
MGTGDKPALSRIDCIFIVVGFLLLFFIHCYFYWCCITLFTRIALALTIGVLLLLLFENYDAGLGMVVGTSSS